MVLESPLRKGRFSEITDWKEQYRRKLCTPEEAVELIRDGDVIAMTGGGSWPQVFGKTMADNLRSSRHKLYVLSQYLLFEPELLKEDLVDQVTMFDVFLGQERRNQARGNVDFVPIHLGHTGEAYRVRDPRVCVITCSPPDKDGWMSRSIWGGHLTRDTFEKDTCETLVVEVNDRLPYIPSEGERHLMLHVSEADYFLEGSYSWPEVTRIKATEVEEAIAGYCAELIRNGDCIQLGLGGLADAIGSNLVYAGKRDLGLHTEVLSNCIAELMQQGVINNSKKQLLKGKSVGCYVIGDRNLWDFCKDNPHICQKEIDWVNDPYNLSRNDNVVSINNAMEIDLFGQVASEAVGTRQYTGTGGQLQWVFGSQLSKGGKSIIAINSTYKDKTGELHSKIKPVLGAGSLITTPRTCVEYVITEYGVAYLKYKSVRERMEALINIAHPDFRDQLRMEAKKIV